MIVDKRKITDNVYIATYNTLPPPLSEGYQGYKYLIHVCNSDTGREAVMHLRKNEAGPLYWCPGCGFTLEGGLAMAIRLDEVEI